MPKIGKPTPPKNPFKNVKMHPKEQNAQAENLGTALNKAAGRKDDPIFVDKNQHNKMGKDEFLKLLTYQLSNQDPLNPVDQKKFAADLAQFAQLEQLTNMNKVLEQQNTKAPEKEKFFAASILGKMAMTKGTSVKLEKGVDSIDIPFGLERPAKNIAVQIFDSKGQIVSRLERENIAKGNHVITWDAKAMDGYRASNGEYTVDVIAWDEAHTKFNAETKSWGKITDVHFDGSDTVLTLDGRKKVFLRDVESLRLISDNKIQKRENLSEKALKSYQAQESPNL